MFDKNRIYRYIGDRNDKLYNSKERYIFYKKLFVDQLPDETVYEYLFIASNHRIICTFNKEDFIPTNEIVMKRKVLKHRL